MTPQAQEICKALEWRGLRGRRGGGARTRTSGQKTVVFWRGGAPLEGLAKCAWALRMDGWKVEQCLKSLPPHLVVWAKLPLLDRA